MNYVNRFPLLCSDQTFTWLSLCWWHHSYSWIKTHHRLTKAVSDCKIYFTWTTSHWQCESWEELKYDIESDWTHQHHQHYNDGLVICKSEWNIFAVGKWRSLVIIWSCCSITPRAGLVQPGADWSSQDQHLLNVAVLTTGSHRSTFETVTVKNQWCKH